MIHAGLNITPHLLCPTWRYLPHTGWRGFLIRRLRFPKKWFQPEERERVIYQMGDMIICSYETYSELKKAKA